MPLLVGLVSARRSMRSAVVRSSRGYGDTTCGSGSATTQSSLSCLISTARHLVDDLPQESLIFEVRVEHVAHPIATDHIRR
jgi:hypothetical protein